MAKAHGDPFFFVPTQITPTGTSSTYRQQVYRRRRLPVEKKTQFLLVLCQRRDQFGAHPFRMVNAKVRSKERLDASRDAGCSNGTTRLASAVMIKLTVPTAPPYQLVGKHAVPCVC